MSTWINLKSYLATSQAVSLSPKLFSIEKRPLCKLQSLRNVSCRMNHVHHSHRQPASNKLRLKCHVLQSRTRYPNSLLRSKVNHLIFEEKPSTPMSDFSQVNASESTGGQDMLISSNGADQLSQHIEQLGDQHRRSDTPLGDEKLSDSSPEQSLSPNPPPLSHQSCDDVNLATQPTINENLLSSSAPASDLLESIGKNDSKGHLFEDNSTQGIDPKIEDDKLAPKESPLELSQSSVITSPPPPSPMGEITTATVATASAAAVATAVAANLTSSSKKIEPASEKPVSKSKIVETKTARQRNLL